MCYALCFFLSLSLTLNPSRLLPSSLSQEEALALQRAEEEVRRLQCEMMSLQRMMVEIDLREASKQHVQELQSKEQGAKGGSKGTQRQQNASAQL